MAGLKFYRILTFILLPIEILFGLLGLLMLVMSLGNPAALLPAFMIACTVIYIFSSFRFLNNGIQQNQLLTASLKNWVKVNGYVSMAFATLMIFQSISVLFHLDDIQQFAQQQVQSMQAKMQGQKVPLQMFKTITIVMICCMLCYAILLSLHVIKTFSLLQLYKHLFEEEE